MQDAYSKYLVNISSEHIIKDIVNLSCLFSVFNAIVRLCMTDILPTVNRTLKLPKSKDPNKPVMPSSSKQWTRIRADVKTYITDIIQVFEDIFRAGFLKPALIFAPRVFIS